MRKFAALELAVVVLSIARGFAQDLELLRSECLSNGDFYDPNACYDEPVKYSYGQTEYTCEEQKSFGNCDEDWMIDNGFCKATCGICSLADVAKMDESLCVTNVLLRMSADPDIQQELDSKMYSLQDCNAEENVVFLPTGDALLSAHTSSGIDTSSLIRERTILDTLERVTVSYYNIPQEDGMHTVFAKAGNELVVTVTNGEISQVRSSTDSMATNINNCLEACNGKVCSVDLFI